MMDPVVRRGIGALSIFDDDSSAKSKRAFMVWTTDSVSIKPRDGEPLHCYVPPSEPKLTRGGAVPSPSPAAHEWMWACRERFNHRYILCLTAT